VRLNIHSKKIIKMINDRELLQQALVWLDDGGTYTDEFQNFIDAIRTRLAQPEPELEPFGYFQFDLRLDAWVLNRDSNKGVAFYTAQEKKEWVGLTDEEISELIRASHNTGSFVRVIEAKLK